MIKMGSLQHLLFPLLTLLSITAAQIFETAPSDQSYQIDVASTGRLRCVLNQPLSNEDFVVWNFEGKTIVFASSSSSNFNQTKYGLPNLSSNEKDFSLEIKDLRFSDSGTYKCQYGISNNPPASAKIIVGDVPLKPELAKLPQSLIEGQEVNITCVSYGGHPAPTITWTLNNVPLTDSDGVMSPVNEPRVPGGLSQRTIRLSLKYEYHQKRLVCQASNQFGSNASEAKVLNVAYKPRITIETVSTTVTQGSRFSLKCVVNANPTASSIQWKEGDVVASSGEKLEKPNGIQNDTVFTCIGENIHGRTEESLTIGVQYAPKISISPASNTVTIAEDDKLNINCAADARPPADITWIKDGEVVSSSGRLEKAQVSKSDRGVYTCRATNTLTTGQISTDGNISVNVLYAPDKPSISVTPAPSGLGYRAGAVVVLSCLLDASGFGNPAGRINWYKKSNSDRSIASNSRSFTIQQSKVTDSGEYYCIVNNSQGSEKSVEKLIQIHDKPEFVSMDPTSGLLSGNLGDNSALFCLYRGFPAPQIIWKRNGDPVNLSQYTVTMNDEDSSSYPYIVRSSTLEFKGTQRNGMDLIDVAEFSCLAENSFGSTGVTTFNVTVNFGPMITKPSKFSADVGQPAELICAVNSYPRTTEIKFMRNSNIIQNSPMYSLSDIQYDYEGLTYRQMRKLTIPNVDVSAYGEYICQAANGDTIQGNLTLQRPGPPDAPSNLEYSEMSYDSFMLTWSAGFNGGSMQTFRVLNGEKIIKTTTNTSVQLTGFYPEEVVRIKVVSFNQYGASKSNQQISITTKPYTLPKPNVMYDDQHVSITVISNMTNCCAKIYGSDGESSSFSQLSPPVCQKFKGTGQFPVSQKYKYYEVEICLNHKQHICSDRVQVEGSQGLSLTVIIIIVAVSVAFLLLVTVVVIVSLYVTRRKRQNSKKPPAVEKSGYENHMVINPSNKELYEFDDITPYGTHNDLSGGDFDNPYANPSTEPVPDQPQNLENLYASVQKADHVNKLNDYSTQLHVDPTAPSGGQGSLASNSDNTDPDQLDAGYSPRELKEIIGDPSVFPHLSISDSDFSRADSRNKKIIYEAIV